MEANNRTVKAMLKEYDTAPIFNFSVPPYSWTLAAKRRNGDTKVQKYAYRTVNQLFSYFYEFSRIEGTTVRPESWRTKRGSILGAGVLPEDHPSRKVWKDLGDRFNWMITRENSADIVAVATPLVLQAESNKVVLDLRTDRP